MLVFRQSYLNSCSNTVPFCPVIKDAPSVQSDPRKPAKGAVEVLEFRPRDLFRWHGDSGWLISRQTNTLF
jgi:hypothetical protein